MTDLDAPQWYILKQPDGTCQIKPASTEPTADQKYWGPYGSKDDAISRRVGLIRSGQCLPM